MTSVAFSVPSGRLKSPYMGVPVPGSRPLVFLTDQVRGALAGTTVTRVKVIKTGEGRALEVLYAHGKNQGRAVFYDRCTKNLFGIQQSIREWAEAQRKRLSATKLSPKARRAGVAIRRLEKEKRALRLYRPVNPLLQREGYHYTTSDGCRSSEQQWHDEKPKRKLLASVAGRFLKSGKVTSTTAYKLLRDIGFKFEKFSDLRQYGKDRIGDDQCEYWKHIHFFVDGMIAEPQRESRVAARFARKYRSSEAEPKDVFQRHSEARVEYIVAKRQAESLELQIAAMKELAA
jgi:hypothetical protein